MIKDRSVSIIAYRGDTGACWYYRLHLPLVALTKNHLNYTADVYGHIEKNHMGSYDIVIMQRQYNPEVLEAAKNLKRNGARLIYEIDDDLFHVPKWNPASVVLGKRKITDYIKKFLSYVDAVFVSTEYLKTVYQEYNQYVYVLPNSIALDAYTKSPKNSDKKVICWQGSNTHEKDLKILDPAFKQLLNDGDVFIKMWSADFPGTYKVPVVEFRGFHQLFSQIDAYIGLAPLVPNIFNKSKSNLKFLEYSAQRIITIASNFGPYTCIENGKTGYSVSDNRDWYDVIRWVLDEQTEQNKQILDNAHELVSTKFNLDKNYILWKQAIDETIERVPGRTKDPRFL